LDDDAMVMNFTKKMAATD